jgi:hypothetical protein
LKNHVLDHVDAELFSFFFVVSGSEFCVFLMGDFFPVPGFSESSRAS